MKKKSELLTDLGLFFAGMALVVLSIHFFLEKLEFYNQSTQTEGIIIDIGTFGSGNKRSYRPFVAFQTPDGKSFSFSSEMGTNSPFDFTKGDKIMVRYLESNPQQARIDSFIELWGLPSGGLFFGFSVFLIGGFMVYTHFHKMKLKKELPMTGTHLQLPGRVKMKVSKNKTEFVIIAEWLNPADSKVYTFSSDSIPFDPTSYIAYRLIDVWIAPLNPKKNHYMDLSFLPEKA